MKKSANYQKKTDSPTAASGKPKVDWKGYVNWELTTSHKRAFDEWLISKPDIDALIEKVMRDGYDVKQRYDERNDAFSAQLYCTDPKNPNAGWCLSMRSKYAYTSLLRVIFVHYIALQESWATQGTDGWSDDQW